MKKGEGGERQQAASLYGNEGRACKILRTPHPHPTPARLCASAESWGPLCFPCLGAWRCCGFLGSRGGSTASWVRKESLESQRPGFNSWGSLGVCYPL